MVERARNDRTKPAGPAPTEHRLHAAALAHLARYGTTRAGLIRVLDRRVDRWARLADEMDGEIMRAEIGRAKAAARAVADQLAASGAIDDAAFAASRARGLARAGKSARAVAAHLQAHGVASDLVRDAVPEDAERELAAALSFARRRRIGPFRRTEELEPEEALRELGMLARAGYPREVAGTALRMDADEATDRINRARLP